ncbi:MAG: response regulator [Verrucomicrobiales bacterium]|nr:response regulator [Verrucomicrobiales bacterium]
MVRRILVIDDEAGFTKLLKMNLEKTGQYEVRIENDSMKALNAAHEFLPDAVLLDIVMPGLDGGDVAAQMQAEPLLQHIPVIMMTALVSQEETSQDAVAQAGAMNILPKPVNLDVLLRCLEEVLSQQ